MRKFIITLTSIFITIYLAYSQKDVFRENFDSNTVRFTISPTSSWKIDTNFYLSTPNCIRGVVPNKSGDMVVLTSPVYDLSTYNYVYLQFSHICKVSPMDVVTVEYKISNQTWKPIPPTAYLGNATLFQTKGFSASSYTEWQVKDSLAYPDSSWWKQEVFDVSFETKADNGVQFRFVIRRGNVTGTQISYGWLLDDVEIVASSYEVRPPSVAFLSPFVRDTVTSTGPWVINAKVRTVTAAPIQNPYLVFTATYNGTVLSHDSVLMTMVRGDSLWKGVIPQFVFGTEIACSITGRDTTNNTASISSNYVIKKPIHIYGDTSVALTIINSPEYTLTTGNVSIPVIVTIRNRGDSVLTSAMIYWSVNGVLQPPYPWTGSLIWDFEKQITLGNYISRIDDYDTIRVWVNMPNGIPDVITTDDELSIIVYGCMSNVSGIYTVGEGEIFPTITSAINALRFCPPSTDIVLRLKNGVYPESCLLTSIGHFMGTHSLTITSLTGDRDSVIVRPATYGFRLDSSNNVRIEDITIDVVKGTYGVQFIRACTNVVINRCTILGSTTGTSGILIYKGSGTTNTAINKIRITNCILQGGSVGISLDGVNVSFNSDITVDSNIICDQYGKGIYFKFTGHNSISYNKITARYANQGTGWTGIDIQDGRTVGKRRIAGNQIRSDNPGLTVSLQGMYLRYLDTVLFANNEIYLNSSAATTYGIRSINPTEVNHLHNTVVLTGKGGATFQAIDIHIPTNFPYTETYVSYKNNIFVANGGASPYAIHLDDTPDSNFLHYYQINSNNYYSTGYLGYTGSNQRDLAAWQSVMIQDSNSVNKLPDFLDPSTDLKLSSYVTLYCKPDSIITTDIRDSVRITPTQMGCYEADLFQVNGTLSELSGMREGVLDGVTDSLKVIFTNNGTTTLHSVNLGWSVNGTFQSSKEYYFYKPLSWLESDTIDVAMLTYMPDYVNVRVWINSCEGGTLSDEFTRDDTVSGTVFICSKPYSGVIPISDTSSYSTIDSLLNHLSICGLGGDITIVLDSGTYTESCDFSFFGRDTTGSKITMLSKTGKAEDVVIKPASIVGITLSDVRNFTLKSITVNATPDTNQAILFRGACKNVLIRDCRLLGSQTTKLATNILVNSTNMGVTDSIFFINNLFNGGYQAVLLNGGIGTGTDEYGTNFIFDSNTVTNQYLNGVALSYVDMISCSYNKLTGRTSTVVGGDWNALTLSYINGPVIGNRIIERNTAIQIAHGIDISFHHYYPTSQVQGKGLIANNEILLTDGIYWAGVYVCMGMTINNSKSEIIHNSIYISGSGGFGVLFNNSANNEVVFKNNNVVLPTYSTDCFPVDIAGGSVSKYDVDYNNIYGSPNLGYYNSAAIQGIAAWQQIMTTDTHSVSVLPSFKDIKTGLELWDDNSIYCDIIPSVNKDVNGYNRKQRTAMGCYEEIVMTGNAVLREMTALREGLINGETENLKVVISNRGTTPLTSINLGMSVNGSVVTSKECYFNTPLLWSQTDTVDFTALTYIPGTMNLKVWINSFNAGTLSDENPTNDTLSASTYVCPNSITGIVPISPAAVYSTITSALETILKCGYGDITLLLDSGLYEETCDFSNINAKMTTNKLTLTSKTAKAEDVVIKPKSGATIILSNTRNLVIKDVTLDVTTASTQGISFRGSCTNIVVRDCRLLGHQTSTSSSNSLVTTVTTNTIYTDSIFFINNLFNGGYRAFLLKGGMGTGIGGYGTNFIFDSNTVTNQYTVGITLSYLDMISCSHNTISSRTASSSTTWSALSLSYVNGPVTGNKIAKRNTAILYGPGISIAYHNCYPVTKVQGRGLIANNEVFFANGSIYTNLCVAMSINNSKSDVIHNSIHVHTTASATANAYGLYLQNSKNNDIVIKNNNIVMTGKKDYPVIFADTGYLNNYDIDYNNYYNLENIAYYKQPITTMTTWKKLIKTDQHSVAVLPSFVDISAGLELSDCHSFYCDLLPAVATDIKGVNRSTPTVMGCYEENILPTNGALTDVLGLERTILNGETDNIKVVFTNKGSSVISSAKLEWSVNGLQKSPVDISFNPPLTRLQSDTISLGTHTYTSGDVHVKIWIDTLNDGTLLDGETENDTIIDFVVVCPSAVTGILPTGSSNTYTTIASAIKAVATCGVGEMTILLDSGLYQESCDFSNINRYKTDNKVIITSKTGKATDVVIKPTSGAGIVFSNTRNLVLKDVTVDLTSTTNPCILFTDACTNIVVRDCRLLADTVTTNTLSAPVYKGLKTGIVDSIFFIRNLLEGGHAGFAFYGGYDDATEWGTHIAIDSNTVSNAYYYGLHLMYCDLTGCAFNTVLSRQKNTGVDWRGIDISYCYGSLIGNRIRQRSTAITKPYGISSSMHNPNNSDLPFRSRALIANNEIVLMTTTEYGIYTDNSRADLIHNSIYITGGTTPKGMGVSSTENEVAVIKNNNIVFTTLTTGTYPVYFRTKDSLNLYDMDYNNYYAYNIGYYGQAIRTMSAWQDLVPSDQHSTKILTPFINNTVGLELSSYSSLACPVYPGVPTDINGKNRDTLTVIGAYHGAGDFPLVLDLGVKKISCDTEVVYPQTIPVKVEIRNEGNYILVDSAVFGWSLNGVVQPSYSWVATLPLGVRERREIVIGTFDPAERTNQFNIVVWIESLNGATDTVKSNDTVKTSITIFYTGTNLRTLSIEQLVPDGVLCTDDYTSLKVKLGNTGTLDYDLSLHPVAVHVRVTNPEPFSLDTVFADREIKSGEVTTLELTDLFPIVVAGKYDIKIWIDSVSDILYDDTLLTEFVSGKFGLPIDEDFSNGIPMEFRLVGNTVYQWETIPKGLGRDTVVSPQFGKEMLSFRGSLGSMATFSTRQLDLSRTEKPYLSFWYFHDTIPADDYTDVRITIDGGLTYSTLFSLSKYDPVYGWRQYGDSLPLYAVNQCVILVFEAMEKSRSEDVTQYIDRIRITAKRDIEMSDILVSDYTACDLENREWKVVMSNRTDPVLDYSVTPTDITLEIVGTPYVFSRRLQTGSLSGFASDTITLSPTFTLSKGTYQLKAYFSSVMDDTPMNDTLIKTIVIHPAISVALKEPKPNECLSGELQLWQEVSITNTGNLDLSDIVLELRIDTGENNPSRYTTLKDTFTNLIPVGVITPYTFTDAYTVPWNVRYYVRAQAWLMCDSVLANHASIEIIECVDMEDLYIVSIDTSSSADISGSQIQVTATLANRSDMKDYSNVNITVLVENSRGEEVETFTEVVDTVNRLLDAKRYTFTRSYTVPSDAVYYLTVYTDSYEQYRRNDTMTVRRTTDYVGIDAVKGINRFIVSQNVPNPAHKTTRIKYSIPESGEVLFQVHSITGQVLYFQTTGVMSGEHSIEIETGKYSAGVYFYSLKYKGERIIKRMIVK